MNNSAIYKEIDIESINIIAKNIYGNSTTVQDFTVLKGGLFNTTYYLKTNNDENGLVLRVAPINKHLLFDFEKDMMSAEPFFYNLIYFYNLKLRDNL